MDSIDTMDLEGAAKRSLIVEAVDCTPLSLILGTERSFTYVFFSDGAMQV